MTLCLAMKVRDGLVAMADTQVTTGTQRITVKKVSVHSEGGHCFFLMTSGLRSIRDKAVTYFDEAMEESVTGSNRLYKVVNDLAAQIRRVRREDSAAIESAGMYFDLAALVGGQLGRDDEHKLYLLYPEGNWVEVTRGTPYFSIGEGGFGKPLLDRALRYETSMRGALKIGLLAFDATITSSNGVDFPIDVALYRRQTNQIVEHRYHREDLTHVSQWWQEHMREGVEACPSDWTEDIFAKLDGTVVRFDPTATAE